MSTPRGCPYQRGSIVLFIFSLFYFYFYFLFVVLHDLPFGRLTYDPSTGQYNEPDGVGIRVANFGLTKSVEYLDNSDNILSKFITKYFHQMVEYFVKAGYTRDADIVAAPYDWRKSPCM